MALGRTKEFKPQEFIRILLDNGFEYERCKGSHKHFRRGKEVAIIPARNMNKMMARRLITEHNLVF